MAKHESKETGATRFEGTTLEPPRNESRYEKLEEVVRDLAAGQHDLDQRLESLVSLVAAVRDGDTGAAEQAISAVPLTSPASPATSPRQSRCKRMVRFILRHTLGAARRIWIAASPTAPWADQVDLRLSGKSTKLPRLAIIHIADEKAETGDWGRIKQAVEPQTDMDFDRVVWHPGSGVYNHHKATGEAVQGSCATAAQLAQTLDVDYLWTLPSKATIPPPTFIETGRLLLSSEPLPFVRFERPQPQARQPPAEAFFWVIPELWHGEESLDLKTLSALAKRSPERPLGKVAGPDERDHCAPQGPLGPGNQQVARRAGKYFVAGHCPPRRFDHTLAKPTGCNLLRQDPAGRDSALILLNTPLTGGVEESVAAMIAGLDESMRLLVVNLAQHEDLSARRLRHLGQVVPHVYSLLESFAPEFHSEVLAWLIETYSIRRLVHFRPVLSRQGCAADPIEELRRRFPEMRIAGQPSPPFGLDHESFDRDLFPAEVATTLRRDLGLENRDIVVTMVCDLIPEKRPEDFVALAHRCRDEERLFFLLVGEGPLASTVGDLHRCFGLSNFLLQKPHRHLAEYLAVTDVVCVTAESELFPRTCLAALAMARPVIATAVDDLPDLLAAGPCGLTPALPGQLDDLESAIRALMTDHERHALGQRGPEVAARYPSREELVEAYRQVLGLSTP